VLDQFTDYIPMHFPFFGNSHRSAPEVVNVNIRFN